MRCMWSRTPWGQGKDPCPRAGKHATLSGGGHVTFVICAPHLGQLKRARTIAGLPPVRTAKLVQG